MKIAFVSTMAGNPWGGSEVLWSEACRKVASRGHQVFVAYQQWPMLPAQVQALATDFGIDVFQIGQRHTLLQRIARVLLQQIRIKPRINREREWLRQARPDLLCISNGGTFQGAPWMETAITEGVPFVWIAQANTEILWASDREAEMWIALLRAARRCYFVSHGNLELLQKQLGYPLENAEVVSNHSAALWNADADWPSYDDGVWRLACVGRLHPPSKGQDLLIDVLRQPQWRDRPLLVSLYGAGPQERCLRRLVEANGLERRIRFCGHVKDIAQIWRDNHALIMPSRHEGLPLALVEALLCGRTAIVTDVAGNAEVLEHGITGFIAEAAAVRPLARAMEEAWNVRERWREMGQRASETIRKQVPEDPGGVLADKLLELATPR
ncbi:glycosyltransferase family 4 protein [Candidatus Thiodictyon syntrophicum]|jgi:glycosyltransferase involved in cell wall biosynthesis|uniref:Glycosyltransferase subfamily 4-like N-terminal domain-containing protein n=1 Tax=Candidatus Thiodictyon syntrophicum TaxID=1166950 RepID=A0A2K8UD31_9GAMM|nr:glycosyltransferase family 4 protein [Candidatus Thiodictyon syntrophicum]AUB83466.1 hypothetical protein THSYN_22625 [Candidatus Thiodictyon syntrophicum]